MTTSYPSESAETEHFVTLFDSGFLPFGMSLHASLLRHGQPFHLWVLCMDSLVEEELRELALPHLTTIPLAAVETPELLRVKGGRTRGEYCWTVTPFTFPAVFDRAPEARRVTYLDSDLFFFDDPDLLLREFQTSGKDVLITEHAYDPRYGKAAEINGHFCVQFLTFRRTEAAERVRLWWQERCVEWCFARLEDGKYGDQKYLDAWPQMFPDQVHILRQTDKTLAPWNQRFFEKKLGGEEAPVFYHFHGLRIVGRGTLRLYSWFRIGKKGHDLYRTYADSIVRSLKIMEQKGFDLPVQEDSVAFWKKWLRRVTGRSGYFKFTL